MKDFHIIETTEAGARERLLALAETAGGRIVRGMPAALKDYIRRQIIEILRDHGGQMPGANRRNER